MTNIRSVAVVGGGIVGSAVARALVGRVPSLTVITPESEAQPGWRAAQGALSLKGHVLPRDPLFRAKAASLQMYPKWIEELRAEGGVPIRCGFGRTIEILDDQREYSAIRKRVFGAQWSGCRSAFHLSPSDSLLKSFHKGRLGAFLYPRDGWVNPPDLLLSLSNILRKGGVETLWKSVTAIHKSRTEWTIFSEGCEVTSAQVVILSAGASAVDILNNSGFSSWSAKACLSKSLACRARIPWHKSDFSQGLVLRGTRSAAIFEGEARVGAFETAPTESEISEVLGVKCDKLFPVVDWGQRIRTKDRAPALGELAPGLFLGAALYKSGILLAPWVAQRLADMVLAANGPEDAQRKQKDNDLLHAFSPLRFSE